MKKRSLIKGLLAFLALAVAAGFMLHMNRPDELSVLPDYPFEIADTPLEREQGLSGREPLADDEGLLFVFPENGSYGFWMKDMRFAIDMLWIREDGTIVDADYAVAPDTYPTVFYPSEPIRYVLEVRAGVAQAKGWEVGKRIPLP